MAVNNGSTGMSIPLEKLRGIQDYHNWKFAMKMLLMHEDLWEHVVSDEKAADKKGMKALAKICLSVHTSAYPHVRNAASAFEAWNNLQRAYEDKGLCRRLSLLRSLFSMKLCEYESMDKYLSNITEIVQQLADIGSPLEDDFVAVIMLSGLPPEYDPLIMTLENNNIKLSSETVKSKLLQEHQRRDENTETVTALAARKTFKCFRCKKSGHMMKNCPNKDNKHEKPFVKDKALLTALSVVVKANSWCIDSGATNHMCNDRSVFSDFVSIKPIEVNVANGDKLSAVGQGNVIVKLKNCEKTISGVYFVPKLSANLLSVSAMTNKGFEVTFNSKGCKILDEDQIVATATRVNNVYQLDTVDSFTCNAASESASLFSCSVSDSAVLSQEASDVSDVPANTSEEEAGLLTSTTVASGGKATQGLWHRRLAHLNSRSMYVMKKGMVTGIDYNENNFLSCIACVEGKQAKLPFPKASTSRSNEILGLVHTDLCGPMSQASFGGAKYFLTFTDDFTRKTFIYFLKSKGEVFECFKNFKALAENQSNRKIKILRGDNGCEYVNNRFQAYLKEHGIVHQTTVPYCPAQNGVSERANRTIMEKARCMLQDAGLDKQFWAEAVKTAVYIKNRTPTKAVMGVTPEEKWSGKKVDVSHLRIFGCLAYALVHNRKKLDAKSKQYIFVGYCEDTKGYRLIDPECPTSCIKARDVVFFEEKFMSKILKNNMSHDDFFEVPLTPSIDSVEQFQTPGSESESFDDGGLNPESSNEDLSDDILTKSRQRRQEIYSSNDTDPEEPSILSTDNPLDKTYIPGESSLESDDDSSSFQSMEDSKEYANMVTMLSYSSDEPLTVQEALSGKDAKQWRDAMQDEYNSFYKNNCWTLSDKKEGQKPVKCKWVFKIKRGLNGKIIKYKARLVAKGFTQKYGIDYQETFAPVVRYSTIRMLFAIAAEYNLDIDQLDVKTAFLNGDLHENVFMDQPEGFIIKGKENKVYKLNKSIYGLKQSAKCWYDKINTVLTKKMSFQRSSVEPCVYFRSQKDRLTMICLYVDDILLFTSSIEDKKSIKDQLMKEFEIKDLGTVHEFLGMRVCKEKETITLDQTNYIKNVLHKFKMDDCKPIGTPMEPGLKLTKAETSSDNYEYRNLIGCLMHIAVCTRPDIAHAVSFLSQFNNCFSEIHWKAAKRVLRYLKGTLNYRLFFERSGLNIAGYVDADWASCEVDRKSYTGFVFKIGNSVVSWESRKQKTVALSSTEAEYMGLSDACKEALFIRTFFNECLNLNCTLTLYNDNQSAQKLCENSMFHARTKHIDIRHHFIRDIVNKHFVNIKYLSTDEMPADILTKPLVKEKFVNFLNELSLKNIV